jgi:hypothetical protein
MQTLRPFEFSTQQTGGIMKEYKVYYSTQGYVTVDAGCEFEAEEKASKILKGFLHYSITINDTDIHCAEEC